MAKAAFGVLNPAPKTGFFGRPPKEEPSPQPSPVQSEVTSLSRRLKILEERHENTRRHIDFIDQGLQDMQKKLSEELKTSKWEILELQKSIKDIENKLLLLIKEIKLSASKEDVEILKKYLNYWEPVNFVTRSQVEKIIREQLEDLGIYSRE